MTPRNLRLTLLTCACAVAFFALRGAALGKDTNTQMRFPISLSVTNTCNGELVDFTGELHVNAHVRQNADGSTSYFNTINYADAKGVGETTGDEYVLGNNSQSITTYPAGSTTFFSYSQRQVNKVVSKGSGQNFRFTFLLDYVLDETGFHITLYDFEVRCSGQ